ncbi:MAG: hypothetical protein QOJ32_1928 [Frankiaceae bacterium]|nr:hypothetical protein [Frankiaceae bacterium]
MHWPADSPLVADPPLARWRESVEQLVLEGEVVGLLRYLPGRRVAYRVRVGGADRVVKVFRSARASGNARRVAAIRATPAGDVVPQPLAVRGDGHVALAEYVHGSLLTQLKGAEFVAGCRAAGEALGRLHRSGAVLDRTRNLDDELTQLRASRTPRTTATLDRVIDGAVCSDGHLVPSHRDCHPAQVVVGTQVWWIDLDDAAMAPPGLDVGNFLAHLDREEVLVQRSPAEASAAGAAFLSGYGARPPDLGVWRRLTSARLAVLAETRQGRRDWTERLLERLA